MLQIVILPLLVVYGGYRIVRALLTGVVQINRTVTVSQADAPVAFAFNVALVGLATLGVAWLLVSSLGSVHVSLQAA